MRTALLALILAASAEASLTSYGIKPEVARDAVMSAVRAGRVSGWPSPTAQLRASSGAGRAAAVKVLAGFARSYVASSDFKKRWDQERAQALGPPPVRRTYEQAVQELRSQLETATAQTKKVMAGLQPEQRAQLQQGLVQMREELEKQMADRKSLEEQEDHRYQYELSAYQQKAKDWPDDPSLKVKSLLEDFLKGCADVDFKAKVENGRFVSADDESRSGLWKACYRAGPEATAAARDAAQRWLADLE